MLPHVIASTLLSSMRERVRDVRPCAGGTGSCEQDQCAVPACASVHRVCAVVCSPCAHAHMVLLCLLSLQRIYHSAFHEYAIYTPVECVMLCISPAKLQLQSSQIRRGLPVSPRRRSGHRSERFLIYFFQHGAEEPLSIWNHVEFLHLRYLT